MTVTKKRWECDHLLSPTYTPRYKYWFNLASRKLPFFLILLTDIWTIIQMLCVCPYIIICSWLQWLWELNDNELFLGLLPSLSAMFKGASIWPRYTWPTIPLPLCCNATDSHIWGRLIFEHCIYIQATEREGEIFFCMKYSSAWGARIAAVCLP